MRNGTKIEKFLFGSVKDCLGFCVIKYKLMLLVLVIASTVSFGMENYAFVDDRDGHKYNTVQVDTQVWMAENLNYGGNNNGFCYERNESYCDKFGRLYSWEEALRVCPSGWHLPSKEEYETLLDNIGQDAGKRLKSANGWVMYEGKSGNGYGEYGFSALPAGYYDYEFRVFQGIGSYAFYWSSEEGSGDAYYLSFGYDKDYALLEKARKDRGQSVRCIKDHESVASYQEEEYETGEYVSDGYGETEEDGSYGIMEMIEKLSQGDAVEIDAISADWERLTEDTGKNIGKRSKQDVEKVVWEKYTILYSLYKAFLKKEGIFGGTIAVRFTVFEDGSVGRASIASSTTDNNSFDEAVLNLVKRWMFDQADDTTEVTVPLTFDPDNIRNPYLYESREEKSYAKEREKSKSKDPIAEIFLDATASIVSIVASDRYDNSLDETQAVLGVGGFADFSGFHVALDLLYSIAADSSFKSKTEFHNSDDEFKKYHLNNNKFGFLLKTGISVHDGLGDYGRLKGHSNVEIGFKMEKFYGIPMLYGGYFCWRPFGEISFLATSAGSESFIMVSYSISFNLFNTSW